MKKFLVVLAVASVSSVAMAQNNAGYTNVSGDKHEVFTNKFGDNWFISAGGGADAFFGDGDGAGSFGDRISPTFNIAVGKWFTPGLALRLQYSGLQAKGFTKNASNGYIDGGFDNGASAYKQKLNYMNLHGDVMFNLNALIGGYNPDRVYEIIPYIGGGFTHTYTNPKGEAFTLNGGIINRFRVSSAVDINLDVNVMGVGDKFDGEFGGKRGFDGTVGLTAGLTYRFPNREFRKPQAARQGISEAEANEMRNKINSLASENQNLAQQLAAKPAEVAAPVQQVVVAKPDIAPRSVFFTIGSSKVSPQELVNLGFTAKQMKDNPDVKYVLTGYADAATGSAETNKRISRQRAEAVVTALESQYGIDRSRFTVNAEGGVATHSEPYLNRMVLIEAVK